MSEKKPSCFGVKFNLLKKCKTCKYLKECGEMWIRKETERLTEEIESLLAQTSLEEENLN